MAVVRACISASLSSGSTTSSTPLMPSSASARGGAVSMRALEAVERGQHLAQRRLVEPDLRLALAALDVEVDGEAAARDALGDRLADARLQRLVARRQAQAHVEAAAVDASAPPNAS